MTQPAPRDQHLRILSLLSEIEPLLTPGADPDPITLDVRWSVISRWAQVQHELDEARLLATLAREYDPARVERAQARIALGRALRTRLERHDWHYAQRERVLADPTRFIDATRRLAHALRRQVAAIVAETTLVRLPNPPSPRPPVLMAVPAV